MLDPQPLPPTAKPGHPHYEAQKTHSTPITAASAAITSGLPPRHAAGEPSCMQEASRRKLKALSVLVIYSYLKASWSSAVRTAQQIFTHRPLLLTFYRKGLSCYRSSIGETLGADSNEPVARHTGRDDTQVAGPGRNAWSGYLSPHRANHRGNISSQAWLAFPGFASYGRTR